MVAQLLVRQEVSVSGSEPSKQTFRVRRPVVKVIPPGGGGMTPYSQIALGIVGFGHSFFDWDTNGLFATWNNQTISSIDEFLIWDLPSGVSRSVPVASSEGGVHIDDLGNIIRCDRTSIYVYDAASGALDQTIARGIVGTNNFGSQMDDTSRAGTTYLLMLTNQGLARNFTLLTNDELGGGYVKKWEAPTSEFTSVNSAQGVSVGPDYGYFISQDALAIIRVDVSISGLTETLIVPAGLTGGIGICHYDKGANVVVIVCGNGDIFTYNPDLTGPLQSKTGNGFTLTPAPGGLCKRMKVTDGEIGIIDDRNFVYIYKLADLTLLQVIDPGAVGWTLAPLSHPVCSFNAEVGMIFAPLHALPCFFLFMPQAIPVTPGQIISESQFSSLQGNFLQVIDLIGPAPLPDSGDLRAGPDDRREAAIGKLAEWD